jgi:uncharacterized 2Fe-2S/4Fe-4S cluster protein (DUF4445 family)
MKQFAIEFIPPGQRGTVAAGKSLLDAARLLGIGMSGICDGRGSCHSCRVQITKGSAAPMTPSEVGLFSPRETAEGWRLACQAFPESDCTIYLPPESLTAPLRSQVEEVEIPVALNPAVRHYPVKLALPTLSDLTADGDRLCETLNRVHCLRCDTIDLRVLQGISQSLRECHWECRAFVRNSEVIHITPSGARFLGLAVDLGTTKIAGYLVDLATGVTLARKIVMNPQISYGGDIISRMARAVGSPAEAELLQSLAVHSINLLADDLCQSVNLKSDDIVDAVIVGNTAMHHLLLGLPVKQLATAPYIAATGDALNIKMHDLNLRFAPGAYVHIPANIAGFVGADHTTALLAVDALAIRDTAILMDIGTNTEISLIHGGEISSVSCASGPAFEGGHLSCGMRAAAGGIERIRIENGRVEFQTIDGAPPCGICGSGVMDGLASLYLAGLLDKGGRMSKELGIHVVSRQREFIISEQERHISITQGDIRELQLSKAAIRSGIQILLEAGGLTDDDIDRVIIAGSFGSYLDVESAMTAGMLPPLPRERITQIGNAAGMGAKLALISIGKREEAKQIARRSHYIELATAPGFMPTFTQACSLGRYHLKNGKREEISEKR